MPYCQRSHNIKKLLYLQTQTTKTPCFTISVIIFLQKLCTAYLKLIFLIHILPYSLKAFRNRPVFLLPRPLCSTNHKTTLTHKISYSICYYYDASAILIIVIKYLIFFKRRVFYSCAFYLAFHSRWSWSYRFSIDWVFGYGIGKMMIMTMCLDEKIFVAFAFLHIIC